MEFCGVYLLPTAQGNKRAMTRLTELKKLAETKSRTGDKGKKTATTRPTRQQAEKECIVM